MVFLLPVPLWAGNKKIIGKRVQELDAINKHIVKQVPGIPKDGKIDIKANVYPDKDTVQFESYQINITPNKKGYESNDTKNNIMGSEKEPAAPDNLP